MRTLRAAVWGLGPHAVRNVVPAFAAARGVELAGVFSRNAEVVSAVCAEHGCARWDSADALLADPRIDVVYLATPIALHAEQGLAVLAAGKHFWCEKAIAASAAEAQALAEAARQGGVSLAEGFMYLYHPHFAALRERVASGRLGAVASVVCRFGIPPLERPGFRSDPALGGGAFLDVGSYPISLVCALFPGAEAEIVHAEIATAPGSRVDTAGRALLRYPGGTAAYLEWCTGVAYRNEVDVWGTEGTLFTERIFSKPAGYVPRLRMVDRKGQECWEEAAPANHFAGMLEAFRGLADDEAAAERERQSITRRAQLAARVRDYSNRAGRP